MVTVGDLINFFKVLFESFPGIFESFGKLLAVFGVELSKKDEEADA